MTGVTEESSPSPGGDTSSELNLKDYFLHSYS